MSVQVLLNRVQEAINEAYKRQIDANAVIINDRLFHSKIVRGGYEIPMICGLPVLDSSFVLPDDVAFAVTHVDDPPKVKRSDNFDSEAIVTITRNYSFEDQREILIEECAELIQAAQKMKRNSMVLAAYNNFIEEIADVSIMIDQMLAYIGLPHILPIRKEKLQRQIDRIQNERSGYVQEKASRYYT